MTSCKYTANCTVKITYQNNTGIIKVFSISGQTYFLFQQGSNSICHMNGIKTVENISLEITGTVHRSGSQLKTETHWESQKGHCEMF